MIERYPWIPGSMVFVLARFTERNLERYGGPRSTLGGSIVAGAAIGGLAWAARGRSSTVFGPSEWRGPKDRAELALTFDDGPSPSTPQSCVLLDEVSDSGHVLSCAVCTCGGSPKIAQAIVATGHESRITRTRMRGCGSSRRSSYSMNSGEPRNAFSRGHGSILHRCSALHMACDGSVSGGAEASRIAAM